MVLKQLDIHMQKINLDTGLIPVTKINLKRVKELNVGSENIKLQEENIGIKLRDMGL